MVQESAQHQLTESGRQAPDFRVDVSLAYPVSPPKVEDVTPTTRPKNHGPIRTPSLRGLPDAQRLPGVLSRYRDPNLARSLTEIAVTFAPFAALWAAMWALMHVSYWLTLALAYAGGWVSGAALYDPT